MKNIKSLIKIGLWCGLLVIAVIGGNLSCASPPILQTPNPSTNALPSAMVATIQPASTATILSTAVSSTNAPIVFSQATDISPQDIIRELLGQVSIDRALVDLRKLTGEEPICDDLGCYTVTNRNTGSEGLQRVKKYITDELGRLGYSLEINSWSRSGYSDQNLIAKKQGVTLPDEQIYFVAHMDGATIDQVERYPGADDDASGVVDILELARVLSSYSFSRTVVLFFSTGEEQGSLGVNSYLSQLSSIELSSIKYVVDIDMIGYDADRDGVMQLFHGNHAPSKALTQVISDIIIDYQLGLTPIITAGCP